MGGDGEVAVVGGGVDGSGVGEEARGECEEEGKEHVDSIVAVVLLQMDRGATHRRYGRSISPQKNTVKIKSKSGGDRRSSRVFGLPEIWKSCIAVT